MALDAFHAPLWENCPSRWQGSCTGTLSCSAPLSCEQESPLWLFLPTSQVDPQQLKVALQWGAEVAECKSAFLHLHPCSRTVGNVPYLSLH